MKLFGEKITPTDSFDRYIMTSLQSINIDMYFGVKDDPYVQYNCPNYSLVVQGRKYAGAYITSFTRYHYIRKHNVIARQKAYSTATLPIVQEDDPKYHENLERFYDKISAIPVKPEWKNAITNIGNIAISLKRYTKNEYFFYEEPMKDILFKVLNWLKVNTLCMSDEEKWLCMRDNSTFKRNVRQLLDRMNMIDLINNETSYISVKGCRPFIVLKCNMINKSMEKYTLDPLKPERIIDN